MSKRDYIIRYLLIIKKLRNSKYSDYKEINEYLRQEFELLDSPREISLRTFQRDINEIRTIFNIDIQCNTNSQYYIKEDEPDGFSSRMLEAFDIINSLNIGNQISPFILLEKRCSLGTEYLLGLLKAIKERHVVLILYQKFDEETPTNRELEPYALKEFKGRWYLIAKDQKDNLIKTFALDRIKAFKANGIRFSLNTEFSAKDYFKHCYGIILPEENEPSEIVLSFEPMQGMYVKSYPLHESQKILIDDEKELRISLFLYQTFDLLMELLSYGPNVRVIQPLSLTDKMRLRIMEMDQLYQ
jgi:predicted DNA-binding transcriptional regulator YafY